MEEERGRGWGEQIVRELIDRFPQDEVYITTDIPVYFERLGFLQTEVLPQEIEAKIARVCRSLRPGTVGMVYDRRIERLPSIAEVYRARHLIERYLPRTPLLKNIHISRELDCEAYIKYENLLPIGGDRNLQDELRRVLAVTAREVMTEEVRTAAPDDDLGEVAHEMVQRRLHAIPVVRDGTVEGMLFPSDVVRLVARD